MYFPIKSTQAFWCFLLVIFGPISLTAQEQSCSVSPPQTVEVTEMDYGYTLDWSPEEEASSYRVIVLDTESSEQIFDEFDHFVFAFVDREYPGGHRVVAHFLQAPARLFQDLRRSRQLIAD